MKKLFGLSNVFYIFQKKATLTKIVPILKLFFSYFTSYFIPI